MRMYIFMALSVVGLAACDSAPIDTSTGPVQYCESMADADSTFIEEGGGNGSSGQIFGRLITDVSDQLHDPLYVASVDYTIENLDVGGTQTQGKTNQAGEFSHVLGEGHWLFKHSAEKNGYTCANEFQFEVIGGDTTQLCIDANCL